MKLKKHLQLIFFIVLLFSLSCTPYKNVPYFQDLKRDSVYTEKINNFSQLTLQPGDLLAIHVTSLNHEADAAINYNLERPNGNVTSAVVDRVDENAVVGYLIDHDGNIEVPYIGMLNVSNLTVEATTKLLEDKLSEFLSKPVITVRIQNFKISILGDVKNPNTYNVINGKINVNEALSLAGDLNTTGIRTNVLLIREVSGNREYYTIDLTSKKLFNSPYYYLKNNDIIYVQPNKERVNNDGTAFQKVSVILTVLSILAIIFSKNL